MTQQQNPYDPWNSGFPSAPTSDPRAPFGATPYPGTDISDFAPKKSRLPAIISIVAIVFAVLIVVAGTIYSSLPKPAPTATATPSMKPEPAPSGKGVPFQAGEASGFWEELDHKWTDDSVRVQLRVAITSGSTELDFYAFSHASSKTFNPVRNPEDRFRHPVKLNTNEVAVGWVEFKVPREPVTLVMASDSAQVSGILIDP